MSKYEDKIRQALEYISKNISEDLLWKDISRECGISEYHFHRIFTALMNESPGSYIKRKRLERAVGYLAYGQGENSIVEIAHQVGYSSQANFSKAFKEYFGVTPGDILKEEGAKNSKIGKIKSKYGKDFKIEELYPKKDLNTDQLNYFTEVFVKAEIRDISERKVIFSKSEKGYQRESIFKTWNSLITKAVTYLKMDSKAMTTLGIGHDNPQVTPEDKCKYEACIVIDESTEPGDGFRTKILPSGKYACFYYKGENDDLLQFYLSIYKDWFPKSTYMPGDHPLIERYLNVDPESTEIELEVQFLLKS